MKGLDDNKLDTPFVLLYSIVGAIEIDRFSIYSNSINGFKQRLLEGTLPKFPKDHRAVPPQTDLNSGREGFGPAFRDALASEQPFLLETENGTLDPNLITDVNFRGFGEVPRAAVVCPIRTTGDYNSVLGFLVVGINPRRPYDADYNLFIKLLNRQLATSMASVVLFEEEIRRGERVARAAALDKMRLSEQLAARTQEAEESETKFTCMAELAPVGIFIADGQGQMTFTNDMWHQISQLPRATRSTNVWMQHIRGEDRDMVTQMWT